MIQPRSNFLSSIGYSSGNFGKNLMAGSMDVLFLFLATELLGLSPIVAGTILLGSMVLDAILDPLVGIILDRARGVLSHPVSLILLGAPLTGATFAVVFHLPVLELGAPWLVAIALLLFRTAYSMIDLPHNTLLTTAITSTEERARVATYRFVFSSLATLMLALALKPMAQVDEDGSSLSGETIADLSIWMALAAAATVSISALSVARRVPRKTPGGQAEPYSLRGAITQILHSRECLMVIAAGALCAFGLPLFAKSLIFVADLVFGDVRGASNLLMAMVVGQFAGLVMWIALAARHSTVSILRGAYLLSSAALLLACFAANVSYAAIYTATFLVGFGAAGSYALIWAALSDTVDTLRLETGVIAGGTVFGIAVLLQKASIGLSGLFLGTGLQLASIFTELGNEDVVIFCGTVVPAMALGLAANLLRQVGQAKVPGSPQGPRKGGTDLQDH